MFGMNLKRLIEAEVNGGISRQRALDMAVRKVKGLLESGEVKPQQISLKETAIAFCGEKWVNLLNPAMGDTESIRRTLEADDAVDVTAFSNITGQIVYSAVHQGYENEAFIGDQLSTNIVTKLESEKIPGFQSISDEAMEVHEAMPYPYVGFGESFQQTPRTRKYGLAIALTKEAIFFDRTGLFVKQADGIGFRLGIRKEKEILDTVIGAKNNYNWRNLSLNTFLAAPLTPGLYVNDFVGNELIDWNSVDTALQNFQDVRDPETGDPILVMGNVLLVPPTKRMTANRILSATEIREVTGNTTTLSANPIKGMQVLTSQLLLDRIRDPSTKDGRTVIDINAVTSGKYWWLGDPKKAVWYMENWPLQVMQAPANSDPEFERDIVARWRASERGVASVFDPRFWQRNKLT